jgi:hypothetical protein
MFRDQVRAVRGHEVPGPAPPRVAAGQRVTAERRGSPWPAFVFVTAEDGEGRVPARFLDRSSGPATVLVPDDTVREPR